MGRDRRWDYLYDRTARPVKAYVQGRAAEHLAEELGDWPPRSIEWASDEERDRHALALSARPPKRVVTFALRVAQLNLLREFDAVEELVRSEGSSHWQNPSDHAVGRFVARYAAETCLALKEEAPGLHLTRADLVEILGEASRRFSARVQPRRAPQ